MSLFLKRQGYRKFCVNCILEIHGILNMPQVLKVPRFRMYLLICESFIGYIESFLDIPRVLIMPEL